MITIVAVGAEASPARVEAVRTLMTEYAALPHTTGRWLTMHADLAALPHPFVLPHGAVLLADAGDEWLGCGGLVTLEPGVGEIKRMYVRPTARGRGVGAALLHALLSQAATMALEQVRLDTAPELLEAQALYRRFGFVPIPPYRAGLLPDALCFERQVAAPPNGPEPPSHADAERVAARDRAAEGWPSRK